MPLKIIRTSHSEIIGRRRVLLSVPPAPGQSGDLYMGQVAEEIALLSKAHAIIAKEMKGTSDDEALAVSEFAAHREEFLQDLGVECVLTISGKKDSGIEIRTLHDGPRTEEIVRVTKDRLGTDFDLKIAPIEKGEPDETSGKVQTVSLALGPEVRSFQREAMVFRLVDLIGLIEVELGNSERGSDESSGDVLD